MYSEKGPQASVCELLLSFIYLCIDWSPCEFKKGTMKRLKITIILQTTDVKESVRQQNKMQALKT